MTPFAARRTVTKLTFATLGLLAAASTLSAATPRIPSLDRYAGTSHIADHVKAAVRLQELNCTACHAADPLPPKGGPNLQSAGRRLNRHWITDFLLDPQGVHPQTTMPEMLHSLAPEQRKAAAESLAALLAAQTQAFPELKASGVAPVPFQVWKQGNAIRGRETFHQVGCVACHEPDEAQPQTSTTPSAQEALLQQLGPEELAELGIEVDTTTTPSVALDHVANKYTAEGLFRFLLDPLAVRPGGRMPDCKLSILEAADVAAYLRNRFAPAQENAGRHEANLDLHQPPAKAEQLAAGRRWFGSLNCNRCHDLPDSPPPDSPLAPPLAELRPETPCFTTKTTGNPRYSLSESQRETLLANIAPALNGAARPAAHLQRQLLQFNCVACHARDTFSGLDSRRRGYFETVGNVDLGDEGRLPPPLDGVGTKLRAAWFGNVIAGKTQPLRPYMHARMPRFPDALANPLHQSLNDVDAAGQADASAPLPKTAASVAAGRKLLAVGCIQCHPIAGEALPGVVGVDLADIDKRLHPSWFVRFLRNPGQVKPRTRMPSFFDTPDSAGEPVTAEVRDQQIAAMWHYLSSATRENLPEPILKARAANYQLVPTDRPQLLRTFMDDVGQRAIAVGFPARRHLAYDAQNCRPALLWKGDFLDAEGTWFIRFAPPAVPLGNDLLKLPNIFVLATGDAANPVDFRPRYRGYTLDAKGVPTFETAWGPWQIRERWHADPDRMRREITLSHALGEDAARANLPLQVNLHQAESFESTGPHSIRDPRGFNLRLVSPKTLQPVKPDAAAAGLQTWSLQLPADRVTASQPLTIEVHYQW